MCSSGKPRAAGGFARWRTGYPQAAPQLMCETRADPAGCGGCEAGDNLNSFNALNLPIVPIK